MRFENFQFGGPEVPKEPPQFGRRETPPRSKELEDAEAELAALMKQIEIGGGSATPEDQVMIKRLEEKIERIK